ncbi:MAG: lecithin retinol acyltransferase family protein [Oscillospiraceae bacterium]|nr:lecithin retinol acyltransferase family protein [Oscillospiraceae bacterium]
MKWVEKTPVYGDLIRTKVSFYHHYGIFVSEDQVIQFGLPDGPLRPADEIRVLSSNIAAFLQGGDIEVAEPEGSERKTMRSPKQIVEIATSRLGEGGYDILHNNCEHFVNDCAFGAHVSNFLQDVREKLRKKLGK